MSAFRFEAVDAAGKAQKGVLEADSARSARAQLRAQGLTPLVVEVPQSSAAAATLPWYQRPIGRRLSARNQALITRQFASLLSAGLPMDEALTVLTEQSENERIRQLMASIRAEVLGGHSLADALTMHPREFEDIYRALVAAGEHTGQLGLVLERLADYLEARNSLRQRIQLAFTYPGIVTLVALGIVTLLLTYVVPQVVNVFASTKQKLPLLTVMMLGLSSFVRQYGLILAVVVTLVGAAWARTVKQQPAVRERWHAWLLRWPVLGRMIRDYNTVRFMATLAILTEASVPILRALEAAKDTLGNLVLKRQVDEVIGRVREGSALSRALQAARAFPTSFVHMIRSGEATGKVAEMLERAATGASRDLERRTMFLTTLLEPLLILTMGVVVLVIVLAVMMPIIEINQLVH